MFIKDIMTSDIVTVDANQSIRQAGTIYKEKKVGSLLVIENNDIIGLVTERDFIERAICLDKDMNSTKIKEIMTEDVKTIDVNERVEKAIEMFKKFNIKKLPVTNNDTLVGIVTITDIAYSRPTFKGLMNSRK